MCKDEKGQIGNRTSRINKFEEKVGYVGQSIFLFNDTATTEIYTLSLHDALPIFAERDIAFRGELTGGIS